MEIVNGYIVLKECFTFDKLDSWFETATYNPISDQKAAQSFEYRRFVMLFGSSL